MAAYDLTWKLCRFMDPHFVFPFLESMASKEIYDETDIALTKYEHLKETNMVDFLIDTYTSVHGERPDDEELKMLKQKRKETLELMQSLDVEMAPIVSILNKEDIDYLCSIPDPLSYLCSNTEFHPSMVDTIYRHAKIHYDCGIYNTAGDNLFYYRLLAPQDHKNYPASLWGKFAAETLVQNWEAAKGEMERLKSYIDSNPFHDETELLQNRAWLIHWSLFLFANHPKGKEDIIDMFLENQSYLNTIQVLCPHILRYIAVAVVSGKKRRQCLKDLVNAIRLEECAYQDPITGLLECLYVNYDFDGAQEKLKECQQVLEYDFFLSNFKEEFMESARLLIFEMFCRIHRCISITMLADKLNMVPEKAERWIVNLIRNAQLDAKIDSQLGHVTMGTKATGIHDKVMENTKRLSLRAQQLAFQLEKISIDKRKQKRPWDTGTIAQQKAW